MEFIFFDTEDNSKQLMDAGASGFDKVLTGIAAKTSKGARYVGIDDVDEFLRWLRVQGIKHVYAHNLQYDLGNLFRERLDSLAVIMVGGRIIKATFGGIEFRDSFNIWTMSLEKLGQAFGLHKLTFDPNSEDYIMRDVDIGMLAIRHAITFAETYGVKLPATLGGLAVRIWKTYEPQIEQIDDLYYKEAYYGGRVELFTQGGAGDFSYTDINSLYPSVMLKGYPMNPEDDPNMLKAYGVATVRIYVPRQTIAPLPVRRQDGSIFYPTGHLKGVWTYAEIRSAVQQHGAEVLEVIDAMGTDEVCTPYKAFIDDMYALRLKTDNVAEKLMLKHVMNNLYGQIGMSGEITRSSNNLEEYGEEFTVYGNKVLIEQSIPLPEHVNYLHAAYITSYARLELLEYLRKIDDTDLVYCDTDSVIFRTGQGIPFLIGSELGQMKLEGTANRVQVYAQKMYDFGGKKLAKGLPKRLAEEFINTGKVTFAIPYKIRESIKFYDRGNKKPLSVWRRVTKTHNTFYDKKTLEDGTFSPIHHEIEIENKRKYC